MIEVLGRDGFSSVNNTLYTHANGLSFAYETFGDKKDSPLILVAGLNNQLVRWPVPFCEALVKEGFYVIRFDNRDTGLSEWLDCPRTPSLARQFIAKLFRVSITLPYTLDDLAEDTVGILDALEIPAAHLVGFSMGGMICQIAAGKYPGRVLSLTSMMSNSGAWGSGWPTLRVALQMIKRPSKNRSALDNSVQTLQMIGSSKYPVTEASLRAMILAESKRARNPLSYFRQMAAINLAADRSELLASLKMPVLVISGEDDPLAQVSGGIKTASHIPHAKLQILPGVGHDLPKPLFGDFAQMIAQNATQSCALNI